jgi:hypothetical protein
MSQTRISRDLLAAPGSIVVAGVESGPDRQVRLTLQYIRDALPVVSETVVFRVPEGWSAGNDVARIRLTADGWAAIEIRSIEERYVDDNAILAIEILGDGRQSQPIVGSAPVWLPDGTLLFTVQARVRSAYEEVARRITSHGTGVIGDLVIGDTGAQPTFPLKYIVEGDISGIIGGFDDRPATIKWNGEVVRRNRSDVPYLELGSERTGGANGVRTVIAPEGTKVCFQDPCPIDWRRADGTRLPLPDTPSDHAWTRDGSKLFVHYHEPRADIGGSDFALVHDSPTGLQFEPLAQSRATFAIGSDWLAGVSDWAAVLENDDGQVIVIPFDGSPVIGPIQGTLALVNP